MSRFAFRRNPIPLLSFLLLLFFAVSGWAQAVHDVSITGTVTSTTGEKLPGVTITLTGPQLVTGTRTAVSDKDGRFVFLSVPPGTYTVSGSLEGVGTYQSQNLQLTAGQKTDIPVKLAPASYQEQINVTATAPVIDNKSSEVATTFTSELLEKLPTARNAFYDIAISAPGMASVGGNESWLASPSAYGSAGNENLFLVNGVNATNPRGGPFGTLVNVNYNTVEQVKIVSLGSKAEYGSFSGAAIDVLTKSGSNDFKGDIAYYSQLGDAADNSTLDFGGPKNPFYNPDPGNNPNGQLFYGSPNDQLMTKPVDAWEGSLTAGGPILRDRLWFYGGFDTSKASTDTPLWQPLATWDAKLYDIKLTGDFASNHRAWLAYHHEKTLAGNNTWGQSWNPTMGYDQHTNNNTFQAQYQWVINDRNLASAKYMAIGTNQNPDPTNAQLTPGMINWWKWTFGQAIGTQGSFPYIESYKSDRKTIQLDQTHYAANFMGQHEVKYGIQYTKAAGNAMGGYFSGYANFVYPYPYNYGPATSWWWNGPESWQWGTDENPVIPFYNNKTYQHPWLTRRLEEEKGAFVDDTWTLNDRLSFNLGMRYDRMTAKYGSGLEYNFPTTPGDLSNLTVMRETAGTGNLFDFKDWSPRLGFAYTLTDDRKTVLRGAVGRYFAPLGVESLRRFGPDLDRETVQQYRWYLPFNDIDSNGNGKVDPAEVSLAYQMLQNRPPDALNTTYTKNPSWQLDVAPGTKSPYTDQFEVSLQRQLGRDYSVEVTGIYKRSKNYLAYQEFNSATGQPWQWEAVPYTSSTGYKTKVWQIKMSDYNADGKVDVDDAKFVLNNMGRTATNVNSFNGENVNRQYEGLQLVFNKRYANRWQGMFSGNWSHTRGIAMRTVDQSWYIDGPMIMDNAFGTSLNDFQNNLSGPAPMTPRLMLKANTSYTAPVVDVDFGLRWRFDTGRPFWPIENVSAFATWMTAAPNPIPGTDGYNGVFLTGDTNTRIVAADVSHPSWTPNTSIFDLSVGKTFHMTRGAGLNLTLDVLNAFNQSSPNLVGFHTGDFGRVYSIVQPRTFRGSVKVMF